MASFFLELTHGKKFIKSTVEFDVGYLGNFGKSRKYVIYACIYLLDRIGENTHKSMLYNYKKDSKSTPLVPNNVSYRRLHVARETRPTYTSVARYAGKVTC